MSQNESDLNKIKSLEESCLKLVEKNKYLLKKLDQVHDEIASLTKLTNDIEARTRVIESVNFDELKHDISEIDSKVRIIEVAHGSRSENWKRTLDFLVQLLWVLMAAYLLTKLGLQAPL